MGAAAIGGAAIEEAAIAAAAAEQQTVEQEPHNCAVCNPPSFLCTKGVDLSINNIEPTFCDTHPTID
jgi:hypothetical protein